MTYYTDEDVRTAQEAIAAFFGPDGNFDYYAAREAVAAVAPAIAARALREAEREMRELAANDPNYLHKFGMQDAAQLLSERADEIAP